MFYSSSFSVIAKRDSQVPIVGVCTIFSPSHHVAKDCWEGCLSFNSILLPHSSPGLHGCCSSPHEWDTGSCCSSAKLLLRDYCCPYDFHSRFRSMEWWHHITAKKAIWNWRANSSVHSFLQLSLLNNIFLPISASLFWGSSLAPFGCDVLSFNKNVSLLQYPSFNKPSPFLSQAYQPKK